MSLGLFAMSGLAIFIFAAGPYWLSYLLYRFLIAHSARVAYRDKPAALFVLSVVTGYAWLVVSPVLLLALFAKGDSRAANFVLWTMLLSMPVGAIGWVVMGLNRFARLGRQRAFALRNPLPKYQIWLQDILMAVLSLGFSVTLILNLKTYIKEPGLPVVLAIYEVMTQFVMFFAVLDACRFSERLKSPKPRAIYVFSVMFVNAFVPLPVLTALAWNVWRRGLFLTHEALAAPQIQVTAQVVNSAPKLKSETA